MLGHLLWPGRLLLLGETSTKTWCGIVFVCVFWLCLCVGVCVCGMWHAVNYVCLSCVPSVLLAMLAAHLMFLVPYMVQIFARSLFVLCPFGDVFIGLRIHIPSGLRRPSLS
jgi:hypothetical protein